MSDENRARAIVAGESGYHKDLRDAEQMIIGAGDDPVKLAMAFQRHAEAQRNMLMGILIPSFQTALKPLLDEAMMPVINGLGGLQQSVTLLNNQFQGVNDKVDALRLVADDHTQRLDVLEQIGRDETTAAILKLEQRMRSYEEEHAALVLRLEQRNSHE